MTEWLNKGVSHLINLPSCHFLQRVFFCGRKFRESSYSSGPERGPETTRYRWCFFFFNWLLISLHLRLLHRCTIFLFLSSFHQTVSSWDFKSDWLWSRLCSSARHIKSSLRGFRRYVATRWRYETEKGEKKTLRTLLECCCDCWCVGVLCCFHAGSLSAPLMRNGSAKSSLMYKIAAATVLKCKDKPVWNDTTSISILA